MRIVFTLLVFITFSFSCKKSKPNDCGGPEPNCANVECFAYLQYFQFKLIDKTTGADLVFGANPRYTSADVKIYYDAARVHPMGLATDSANKKFLTISAREEMYLEINGADVYKLTAEFRGDGCCASTVKNLWQDGKMICTCCSDVIPLAVK